MQSRPLYQTLELLPLPRPQSLALVLCVWPPLAPGTRVPLAVIHEPLSVFRVWDERVRGDALVPASESVGVCVYDREAYVVRMGGSG
jgi:hypothetical protein